MIPSDRNAIFLAFQSAWIKDESRLKLMEKSRQIGISWSTAYGADERAAAQGARLDEWVSSRDDIQARLFIEDCKLWAGIMGMAAKDLGEVVLDQEKKLSAYVLQFASGRRIHSMSSNPDAQAGKRGSRVLDEFALHRDQRKMWAIAYPGITWAATWSWSARIAVRTASSTSSCAKFGTGATPRRSACTGSPAGCPGAGFSLQAAASPASGCRAAGDGRGRVLRLCEVWRCR